MSEIRWKLAEYLQSKNITAHKLAAFLDDPDLAEIVYRLVEKPAEQHQIDLSALAAILEGLVLLTDFPVNIAEILEFVPHLPEEFVEKSEWKNVYIYGELEPYDWGDADPMELAKPVRHIPGVGLAIDDEEEVGKPSERTP